MGLLAPRHVRSSQIRDQTCVYCIGRWILYHSDTRQAPPLLFWCKFQMFFSPTNISVFVSKAVVLHCGGDVVSPGTLSDVWGHLWSSWLGASWYWVGGGQECCSIPLSPWEGLIPENDLIWLSTVLRGDTLLYKIKSLKEQPHKLQYQVQYEMIPYARMLAKSLRPCPTLWDAID